VKAEIQDVKAKIQDVNVQMDAKQRKVHEEDAAGDVDKQKQARVDLTSVTGVWTALAATWRTLIGRLNSLNVRLNILRTLYHHWNLWCSPN